MAAILPMLDAVVDASGYAALGALLERLAEIDRQPRGAAWRQYSVAGVPAQGKVA